MNVKVSKTISEKREALELMRDMLVVCLEKPLTRYRIAKRVNANFIRVYPLTTKLAKYGLLSKSIQYPNTPSYLTTKKGQELIRLVNKIEKLFGEV